MMSPLKYNNCMSQLFKLEMKKLLKHLTRYGTILLWLEKYTQ